MDVEIGTHENLALAIQRQKVGVFGNQNISDCPLARQAALDDMGRRRSLCDAFITGTARILGPHRHDYLNLCGNDFQPFTAILTDPVHLSAAARTLGAFRLDDLLYPRQMFGKMTEVAVWFLFLLFLACTGRRILIGLGPGLISLIRVNLDIDLVRFGFDLPKGHFQIFGGKLALIFRQLLRALAKECRLQLADQ